MKKAIAILLVVAVMVGVLAIPAAAAQSWRAPVGYCQYCFNRADYRGMTSDMRFYQYYCEDCGMWTYLRAN